MKNWRQPEAGGGSCKVERTWQWGLDFDQKLTDVGEWRHCTAQERNLFRNGKW